MNSDEYVPTTESVREHYVAAACDSPIAGVDALYRQDFDRWLAAHDAALLEAQSAAELDRRWLEAVAGYRLTVVAERDAARATIDEALAAMPITMRDATASRIMEVRTILSRGVQPAAAGCPFDGGAHEYRQALDHEHQRYYSACTKCGTEELAQPAAETWTDPTPWLNPVSGQRAMFRPAIDPGHYLKKPRSWAAYDAETK